MEFRLLGPLEVADGERPVEIAGAKRRALLALLVLRANEIVRTERLIDDLWGEKAPANAAAALRTHTSRLRKALGPELLAWREWGYVLRVEPESIDLRRFERLLIEADPLPARERAAKLAEALALWRGPPLADLALEPGLQGDIDRLEELHVSTLERRIDADLEAGRNSELIGELESLIAEHPLREHLRGQLILALYRSGRQAEALEIYRETRRVLADELGLEPSPELRELERAILRHDPSLASASAAPAGASTLEAHRPQPPASRRRRWLAGGVAGTLLLAVGAAFALSLTVWSSSRATPPAAAPTRVAAGKPTAATVREASGTKTRHRQRSAHQSTSRGANPNTRKAPSRRSRAGGSTPTYPARTVTVIYRTTAAPGTTIAAARTAGAPNHPSRPKHEGTSSVTVTAPISAMTIRDNFSASTANPAIWNTGSQGTGPTAVQQNGELVLTFPADAVSGGQYSALSAAYSTLCRFDGDFEVTVDYQLLDWPAANGASIGLASWVFPRPNSVASRASSVYSESYVGAVGSEFNSVTTTDTHGTLRLARKNGIEAAYYRSGGNWIALESRPASGGATIALQLYANGGDFAHQLVSVALTNFSLSATESVCP